MYKCDVCGKEFFTTQALGGHRAYCGKLVRVGSEGSKNTLTRYTEGTLTTLTKPSLPSLNRTEAQPGTELTWLEKYWSKPDGSGKKPETDWVKILLSVAGGIVVAVLIYKAWGRVEIASPKKAVNPYKLVGKLIEGIGG